MTDKTIPTWADLEDSLFECWSVVNDLRNVADHTSAVNGRKILDSLAEVYDFRFNRAWDIYEALTPEYYEMKKASRKAAQVPRPKDHAWDDPEY